MTNSLTRFTAPTVPSFIKFIAVKLFLAQPFIHFVVDPTSPSSENNLVVQLNKEMRQKEPLEDRHGSFVENV